MVEFNKQTQTLTRRIFLEEFKPEHYSFIKGIINTELEKAKDWDKGCFSNTDLIFAGRKFFKRSKLLELYLLFQTHSTVLATHGHKFDENERLIKKSMLEDSQRLFNKLFVDLKESFYKYKVGSVSEVFNKRINNAKKTYEQTVRPILEKESGY